MAVGGDEQEGNVMLRNVVCWKCVWVKQPVSTSPEVEQNQLTICLIRTSHRREFVCDERES